MLPNTLFQRFSSQICRNALTRPLLFDSSVAKSALALQLRTRSTFPPQQQSSRSSYRPNSLLMMQNIAQKYESQGVEELWRNQSKEALTQAERFPPAGPYSGRSVRVSHGKVAEAIRSLDGILSRNKVRYYLRLTQRHEKRGEKLRRLRSERWRKQFANEVRQKVQLVTKIRNRGA